MYYSQDKRHLFKVAVLDACRDLIARGMLPTDDALVKRGLGCGTTTIRTLKNELRAEGLIDWSHLTRERKCRRGVAEVGEPTEDERAAIEDAKRQILAEKRGQGELDSPRSGPGGVPIDSPTERLPRVYRSPRFRKEAPP